MVRDEYSEISGNALLALAAIALERGASRLFVATTFGAGCEAYPLDYVLSLPSRARASGAAIETIPKEEKKKPTTTATTICIGLWLASVS